MRKKRSFLSRHRLLLLTMVVAMVSIVSGMFYALGDKKQDVMDAGTAKQSGPVSLVEESVAAHHKLDNILLHRQNWQLLEKGDQLEEKLIKESGVTVQVHRRQLAIGIPTNLELEEAGAWVGQQAKRSGLQYLEAKPGQYRGWDAYEVALGIAVEGKQGRKTFVTDHLYFYYNGNLQQDGQEMAVLPVKKSEAKPVKKVLPDKESKPVKVSGGKLAIVVDDCGSDLNMVTRLLKLNEPFAYAILPYKNFSSDVLEVVKNKGEVAMLHLPMEPVQRQYMSEGKNTICTEMNSTQVLQMTRKAVESLPGIVGVNNHQGSKATSDERVMKAVLQELKHQGMFFLDSRTIASSVGSPLAQKLGVPTANRDFFLDNSTNEAEIRQEIEKAIRYAEKHGSAIAICHARPATVHVWEQHIQEFRDMGVTFVPITDLLY